MTVKVLITGGLGYLGGRITTAFAKQRDFELTLGTRRAPLARPAWAGDARIVVVDLASPVSLDAACSAADCVVHLAAVNEIESAKDPEAALQVNALGTLRLLRAAQRNGVRRFIYISTAHVYGAPLAGTIDELTLPRPIHPYAITHLVAEHFVLAAHRQGQIEGVALRVSNGYGAPADRHVDRWTLLVNDLCRQAVREKILTLNSPGLQMRDFVTLTDISRAVLHFARLPLARLGDGLYNVGGENPVRVCDMAARIAERCESTLGFRPSLNIPADNAPEVAHTLDFNIDRLKASGFVLAGDMAREIDETLRFCGREFGAQS